MPIEQIKNLILRVPRSFFRYAVIGGGTFILDFGLLIFFKETFDLSVNLSQTLSFWLALGFNFALNRVWSFEAKRNLKRHVVMYGLVVLFNFFATLLVINTLIGLGAHYIAAKMVAVLLAIAWNYLGYKYLVFK